MVEKATTNTCLVCTKEVEELKELPCNHSFCLECLKKIEVDGRLNCPTCRNPVKVSTAEKILKT